MQEKLAAITTNRLRLEAMTLERSAAELRSHDELAAMLNCRLPEAWPPGEYDLAAMEFFRDLLNADPALAGWLAWHAIERASGLLIGSGGYFGRPDENGAIELGISIAEEHRRRGFASEILEALIARAFAQTQVTRAQAHAAENNVASQNLLHRCGFRATGAVEENGLLFVRER